jgi:5-hydroxyisourate hydrolase-like protein (transthyretin family)
MQPYSFAKPFCLLVFFGLFTAPALSQTRPSELQRDLRPRNCSIYGRVTINGQPAVNVQISIAEAPNNRNQPELIRQSPDGSIGKTVFSVRTDTDGRYRQTNLPNGRYVIRAASRAFVSADGSQEGNELKTVTLDPGESRDNLDFALVRGGVITGQITDSEGRPVIAQSALLFRVIPQPNGQPQIQQARGEFGESQTDDRGIYRIYGLPPGNYVIGAGGNRDYFSSGKYAQTFYPEASDEKQAKIIQVKTGEEVTGINLRLGSSGKTFEVVGRVVDAETGKPVPNVDVSCQKVSDEQSAEDSDSSGSGRTDRLGNFRITGLKPGKFGTAIHAPWQETIDFYAEPATFEITDGDVSGVEIKAVRGGTISGTSVIEGSNDPSAKSKLAQAQLYIYADPGEESGQINQPSSRHFTLLKPDGTFLVKGVAPGNVSINVYMTRDRSLSLLRIEHAGAVIEESFKITKGENVTDVRLVFSMGTGAINGQVQVVGGRPLPGESTVVQAALAGSKSGAAFHATVDEKGRFNFSNLPNGDYDLFLLSFVRNAPGQFNRLTLAKKRISIAAGAEISVTLLYDPNNPIKEER